MGDRLEERIATGRGSVASRDANGARVPGAYRRDEVHSLVPVLPGPVEVDAGTADRGPLSTAPMDNTLIGGILRSA